MPGSGFEADTGARTASALEGIACEIEVNSPRSLGPDDIAGPEVRLQVRGGLAGFFEIIQAFRRKARVAGSAPDLAGKRAHAQQAIDALGGECTHLPVEADRVGTQLEH